GTKRGGVVMGSKKEGIRAHFGAALDDSLAPALVATVAEEGRHRGEVLVVGLHVARVLAHGELDSALLARWIAEEKRHRRRPQLGAQSGQEDRPLQVVRCGSTRRLEQRGGSLVAACRRAPSRLLA